MTCSDFPITSTSNLRTSILPIFYYNALRLHYLHFNNVESKFNDEELGAMDILIEMDLYWVNFDNDYSVFSEVGVRG